MMDVQGRCATFKPRCPGRGKGETVQGYHEGANSEGANFNFLHRGWGGGYGMDLLESPNGSPALNCVDGAQL